MTENVKQDVPQDGSQQPNFNGGKMDLRIRGQAVVKDKDGNVKATLNFFNLKDEDK